MTRAFHVAPWAASELSMRLEVLDHLDEPEEVAALRCWDGETFTVQQGADVWPILRGLGSLANGCDDLAEHDRHPETRQHNRWARDGLTALGDRVFRLVKS